MIEKIDVLPLAVFHVCDGVSIVPFASIVASSGQNLEEVITRRREQYWHAQDLVDFNRHWQAKLRSQ